MPGSCKPAHRYIMLDGQHRIEVIPEPEGGQRYIPQVWVSDAKVLDRRVANPSHSGTDWEAGSWESLLPEGESYQSLRDARNICARNSGRKEVE